MALPSANAAQNVLAYGEVNLVPLRVHVTSDDKTVTLIETLLLDRTCWPIMPLLDPIEESIQRNADAMAYMLLSDMEVQGMGRTTRHFTNRVDLWSASLQTKIKNQLIPQLRQVAKTSKLKIVKKRQQRQEMTAEFVLKRRSAADDGDDEDSNQEKANGNSNQNNNPKRQKVEEENAKNSAESEGKTEKESNNDNKESSLEKKTEESLHNNDDKQIMKVETSSSSPSPPFPTTTTPSSIIVRNNKKKHSKLVPVRLRLCVNGVRIQDDFIWDLSIPQCPIEFAQSLGKDLNLTDEAVVAIVTSIVEQLDGSAVDDTNDLDHHHDEKNASANANAEATARKHATAAWKMDPKENMGNIQHLVSGHKPA